MRSFIRGLVLSALATTMLVVTPGAAQAVQSPQDLTVSADPANGTPHVLDGEVYAVAEVGDTVVLGGSFTVARNAAAGSPELPRTNLLAFDKATGEILPGFTAAPDGVVRSLAPSADGQSVYVGGQFNAISGVPTYKVARLDVHTGAKVAGFNPGLVNAIVYDVKLSGDRLFIGGVFTSVKGTARSVLAELDPTTGALRPAVDLAFAGTAWGGQTQVFKLDVTPDGSRMAVVGNFRTIAGQPRVQVAVLDLTTSPVTVANWSTGIYDIKCGSSSSTKFDVRDVDFSPDGSYFVVGATGGHTPTGGACDGVTRWETAKTGSALQPTWIALTGGDSVYSVATSGTAVYVGGHFRWFNNPVYIQSFKGPGAVDREGIAALDPVTGVPLSWNPGRDRGHAVWDLVATPTGLWVGNDTERIGRYEFHARIAFFPLAGGTAVPQPLTAQLPVDVQLISPATATDQVVRRRGFTGSTASAAEVLAGAGTGWSTTRGAFVANGSIYTVRTDKTMTKAPLTGTTYGARTTVELNALTAFRDELPSVTSMFYAQGRLYYTLANQNALYMRFFTVESDIVGATRYTAAAGLADLDWRLVRGAFVTDGALFLAHVTSGDLYRVTWADRAPVAGTATVVSGPGSGIDWRSAGLYTTAPSATPIVDVVPTCVGTRCTFEAAVTGLGDAQVTGISWAFGDGSTATGAQTAHDFAPGAFTVTATATTDQAVQGVGTEQLALTNAAPVAEPGVVCAGLECTFDASASSDPDGTIASYTWDFGDGTTAHGVTASHTYTTGGSHVVTLTVEDNRGATANAAGDAITATSEIAFVATAANTQQLSAATRSVVVPAAVQAGDTLLLVWSANSAAAPQAPAGWTSRGVTSTSASSTGVWSRTATASDPGSSVSVTTSGFVKADLHVSAYRGASVAAVALGAETTTTANHKAPDVTVAAPGSWVVTVWADKSATTTGWTAPAGSTVRHTYAGTGAGHVSELLVDSAGAVPVGPWTGLTASASGAALHSTSATVVLGPAG